jgi:hypothetical protein
MPETLTLSLRENSSRSRDTFNAGGPPAAKATRPPLFVPTQQLYYWTKDWQAGELEALRDLAEGRSQTFPNGTAAADWLLSDEE